MHAKIRKLVCDVTFAVTLQTVSVALTWADDNATKPEQKSAEKAPTEAEKPKERSLLEKLGDDLLKEEDDAIGAKANPEEEQTDKMERAVKGMRNAGGKLDTGVTTDETQRIQKQVIKDLDDIINQLENPPPSPKGGGGGGGGGSGGKGGSGGSSGRRRQGGGGGSSLRVSRQGRGGSAQQQQQSGTAEEKAGGQASENASDSSKEAQAQRKAAESEARRRKLELDIWGHLPGHLREELLSTYGERMLPKYEQLVKQFYEALSTQGEANRKK